MSRAIQTVLIVGGEESFVAALARQLELRGYRVVDAPSGKAGSVALRACDPDVVVVDGCLPDTDSLDWIKARREWGDGRRMMLVAENADVAVMRALEQRMRVHMIVQKPIGAELLALQIDRALGGFAATFVPSQPVQA